MYELLSSNCNFVSSRDNILLVLYSCTPPPPTIESGSTNTLSPSPEPPPPPRKTGENMKSFITKRVKSILVNFRYMRFKLLKYKENNKKICNTFDHNFKNIPLNIMRKVSLERYYLYYTMVPLL